MKELKIFVTILCYITIICSMARCNNDKEQFQCALIGKKIIKSFVSPDTSDRVHNIIEVTKSEPVTEVPSVNDQISQKDIDDCFEILQKSDQVCATFVGRGGMLTKESWAFNIILNSENRIEIFRKLFETGSNAGRSYALCGLYLTSADEFKTAKTKYLESVFEMQIMIGCVGYPASNSEFLTVLESGYITRVMVLKKVNLKYSKYPQ